MNRLLLFLVVSAALVGADSPKKPGDSNKDSERIQGTWAAVSYVEDGQYEGERVAPEKSPVRWVVKEDKVTFLADVEGASAEGSFKLDSGKKPKTIDITFAPAPGTKKDQRILGIYELEGETFKICYAADGGPRPTEFKSKAGSKHVLIVFKQLVAADSPKNDAVAQTLLRWRFKEGENINYVIEEKQATKMKSGEDRFDLTQTLLLDTTWTVKGVDRRGKADIGVTCNRVRFQAGPGTIYDSSDRRQPKNDSRKGADQIIRSTLGTMVGGEFTLKMDSRGQINDVTLPDKLAKALANNDAREVAGFFGGTFTAEGIKRKLSDWVIHLPKAAISPKEKNWTDKRFLNKLNSFARVCAYQGTERREGNSVEKVDIRPELTIERDSDKDGDKITSQEGKGTMLFDSRNGRLVEYMLRHKVAFESYVDGKKFVEADHETVVVVKLSKGEANKKPGEKKPTSDQDSVKDELAKFQGTWMVVKTVVDGKDKPAGRTEKITFTGNRIIFHDKVFKDGGKKPEEQIIFSIDPSKKPCAIDLTFPGAAMPDGKDSLFARGIYLLEGDNLKLAFMTGGGRADLFPLGRPTGFEGKDKSTTTILKRLKAVDSPKNDATKEMANFQGAWRLVAGEDSGKKEEIPFAKAFKLTIAGDRIKGLIQEGQKAEMVFTLDPAKQPKAMDVAYIDPEGRKGDSFQAIYSFDGDTLRICFVPKRSKRPTIFSTKGTGAGLFMWTLKRDNMANLQGAWKVVALEGGGNKAPEDFLKKQPWRIVFKGDRVSLSGKDKDLREYRLEPGGEAQAIDIIVDAKQQEIIKARYAVEGDSLRICFSQLTTLPRPRNFNTEGTKYLLLVLRREKP